MNQKRFSVRARLMSFVYAIRGIKALFTTEHNAYIHLLATLIAFALGVVLKIDRYEWLWLTMAIVLVFTAELVNTAIEQLCDVVQPDYSEKIKTIKDLAAAATLVCAIGAVVIGCLIFIRYFI
jgi:diacylglycerol kinase